MDSQMIRKIDRVLDSVREPETHLTVSQLGLVERVRYDGASRRLTVFKRAMGSRHGCCTLIANMLLSKTLEDLITAFEHEFTGVSVEIVS